MEKITKEEFEEFKHWKERKCKAIAKKTKKRCQSWATIAGYCVKHFKANKITI